MEQLSRLLTTEETWERRLAEAEEEAAQTRKDAQRIGEERKQSHIERAHAQARALEDKQAEAARKEAEELRAEWQKQKTLPSQDDITALAERFRQERDALLQ